MKTTFPMGSVSQCIVTPKKIELSNGKESLGVWCEFSELQHAVEHISPSLRAIDFTPLYYMIHDFFKMNVQSPRFTWFDAGYNNLHKNDVVAEFRKSIGCGRSAAILVPFDWTIKVLELAKSGFTRLEALPPEVIRGYSNKGISVWNLANLRLSGGGNRFFDTLTP